MRDADGQRLQLKSKLLIGAASMTAAAMSTAAFAADAAPPSTADASTAPAPAPVAAPAATPAQSMTPIDPPKWLPYVDIGGGVGSGFAIGRANAFVPVWQDLDSLMFVRFGADTGRRHSDGDFNLGLGYRSKLDDEWILGAFAGFDSTQTKYNHTFNQFSFGLEAMSADWDIRANAYLAKKTNRTIGDKFQLYIHDTTIAILQGQEAAMSGFDGEVGYRVFNTDSTDVRVFAGAYTFHHADVSSAGVGTNFSFPYHDITGPKLRAEVNVFDLDMLGSQSRFSVEGQVSHDNVNHTSEYIGATLRIALNDPSGPGAQALDDLDRRMADPVRRQDNVLTQWQFNKPEPVIIYNGAITSKPTNTLYYAEQRSGTGAGSYADQTTIQDATSRGGAGKNAFIVLTDTGGSTIDATGTTVRGGETLTGAGTFKIRGANSTYPIFTHDFAPGSGAVSLSASSGNVLNVDGDANIAGLSIVGPFTDGIYGANVGNVTIADVSITGGANGIVFKQTNTSGTSNIDIKNSSITGVTGDGIDLTVSQTAGSTSTTNLIGSNLTINAGVNGVSLGSSVSGLSNATVYAGIHNSSITAGVDGIKQVSTVAGGTLNQTVVVDPTAITGGHYGVFIHGAASGGALTQNFVDTDGSIHGSFDVYASTGAGGSIVQSVQAANVTVPASGTFSIGAHATGGSIAQTVGLSHVVANGNAHNDIDIFADAYNASTINQTVSLSHVQASGAGYNGAYVEASASYGAKALQTVTFSDLTASNNAGSGVSAIAGSYSKTSQNPSVAAQYLTIDGATLSGNTYDGVSAQASATANAVVRQDLNVLNATIQSNAVGIAVVGTALDGASSQQNIYFASDVITHNATDGIELEASAQPGNGFAAQYGSMYNVDVSYNGNDGIFISATADAADAEQQFYMVDITADHEGRDGVEIKANATNYTTGSYTTYAAHVQQDIYVIYSDLSYNARNGLEIFDYAGNRAQIDQTVFAYGSHMDDNADYGFYAQAYVEGPATATYANGQRTNLNSNLYVENSTADHNGLSGVYIYSSATGGGVLTEKLTVQGSDLSYNGETGLTDTAYATGYLSENIHYVTLAYSAFDNNSSDGAYLAAVQYKGPGPFGVSIQFATISGSSFSNNAGDGLYALAESSGENGRAEQYFTIDYSTFSNNTGDGLDVFNHAHDGQYNAGFNCFAVQGTTGGCAIVRSSVSAVGSHFDDNGDVGIVIDSFANNYGTVYAQGGHGPAPSLYLAGSTLDGNARYGLVLANGAKYGSGEIQTAVITGTDISHNGRSGIFGINSVKYSQQYQSITIAGGSTIEHNADDGIYIRTVAKYTPFDVNLLTVNDSSVSNNDGSGVYVQTQAKYDFAGSPGGVFEQAFYASGSTFDANGNHGVFLEAYAGNFVYAYQVVQTQGNDFSGNGTAASNKYGLAAVMFSLHNVYGGQYVTSQNDTFSHNTGAGMEIGLSAIANKYVPFHQDVSVTGDHFDNNDRNGLYVGNEAKYGTLALYQKLTVADTTFDNNGRYGLYDHSYAADGGTSIRMANIYSYSTTTSASGNGASGIFLYDEARNSGTVNTENTVRGITLSGNTGAGLLIGVYGDGTSNTEQYNYIYSNTANSNQFGISLGSTGSNGYQKSFVGGNTVGNNTVYGITGYAGGTSFQYVDVYSLGNTVSGSGVADYYFNAAGGATQNLN